MLIELTGSGLGEHKNGPLKTLNEAVYLFPGVIETKGCSYRSGNLEIIHHRLSAVMTGSNRYSHLIKDGPEVIWMNIFKIE